MCIWRDIIFYAFHIWFRKVTLKGMKRCLVIQERKMIFFPYWTFNPITRAVSSVKVGFLCWKSESENSKTWCVSLGDFKVNFSHFRHKFEWYWKPISGMHKNSIHYSTKHNYTSTPPKKKSIHNKFLFTNKCLNSELLFIKYIWHNTVFI